MTCPKPYSTRARAHVRRAMLRFALLAAAATLAATCGGTTAPSSPSTGGGGNTQVFTVSATGVTPRTMTVPNGSRVVFVNRDSRPHNMTSDPHPTHEDCPELNQIGFLNPGQQRESGNLVEAGVCGFHDHDNPGTTSLQGTITIR